MKEKITQYLIEKYEAKGVILYGSRAVGKELSSSDWDIFIFSDKPEDQISGYGEINEYEGQQIDLSIYPTTVSDDFILDTATHPVAEAIALFDGLNGKVEKIVQNSKLAYERGPKTLTQRQKDLQRKILRKFLNKAESRPEDIATIYFGVSQFYIFTVRYWFELQGRWPLSFYEALEQIKILDIEYFSNLEKLHLLEYPYEEKIKAMRRFYELVIMKQDCLV